VSGSRLRSGLILGGALLLLSLLFLKTELFDLQQHARYQENLHRLRALDAMLNEDIVRAHYELLTRYDPLVATQAELGQLANELRTLPAFVEGAGRVELSAAARPTSTSPARRARCWSSSSHRTPSSRTR
jgi:DAHL domain-containing protein